MGLARILPRILHVSGGMAVEGRRWRERAVLKKIVVSRKKGTEKGELNDFIMLWFALKSNLRILAVFRFFKPGENS